MEARDDLAALAARLDRLEAECASLRRVNRRWRRGGVAGVVMLLAIVAVGATQDRPRTVEAERFVLRGSDGKARAVLGTAEGGALLTFTEPRTGRELATFGVRGGEMPTLDLLSPDSEAAVLLTVLPEDKGGDDAPRISLLDRQGRQRLTGELFPGNVPSLSLHDEAGRPRVALNVMPRGPAGLVLLDDRGQPAGSIVRGPDGASQVILKDARGGVAAELPAR